MQEMEEEAAAKRARKAAEAAFLQLLKDNTPADAAGISPRKEQHSSPSCNEHACVDSRPVLDAQVARAQTRVVMLSCTF